MYSTYELLPDKKMPAPTAMKKKKSDKSLIEHTEGKAGEIEDKERETEEKPGPSVKEKVTVENESTEYESAERDSDSVRKQGKCKFVSIKKNTVSCVGCLNCLSMYACR